eukprot:Platyproteum_vivax@DN14420_c0_g1_i1.p2
MEDDAVDDDDDDDDVMMLLLRLRLMMAKTLYELDHHLFLLHYQHLLHHSTDMNLVEGDGEVDTDDDEEDEDDGEENHHLTQLPPPHHHVVVIEPSFVHRKSPMYSALI